MITSRHNRLVKRAREVREGRERELVFVEGVRLCEQVLNVRRIKAVECFFTSRVANDARGQRLLINYERQTKRAAIEVTDDVLEFIAETKTPQGIVLIAARPVSDEASFDGLLPDTASLLIALNRLNNPANAAAVLRTAEAVGVCGFITSAGTADVFSPKALRAAMGATFRLAAWTNAEWKAIKLWCERRGFKIAMLDANGAIEYTAINWRERFLIVAGAEADGFTKHEISLADVTVSIPMCATVESLNVGVATGVLLYEARRQRALPD